MRRILPGLLASTAPDRFMLAGRAVMTTGQSQAASDQSMPTAIRAE
ncbi:hypothetical protein SAMN04488020_103117 [Palleronia marisminoris]|uniref:Uncharacterized protein n=1 Tax=Palleronia marisminoris TaxID=315423 RepID=A0A1Y5S7E1_9RHOB|nr:hypothetical protein [Palleronia marisminoris]SFG65965.1 hypothetical protein SAMN04488020_103117 [Palleronia marisminoris]SLN33877.1 hypothetical protein PAM7066_01397 [Palleronia marisminoris]